MAGADTATYEDEVQEHYRGVGRKIGPAKAFRPQKPCLFEGCTDWSRAQGYCFIHYQKMRKLGVIQAKRIVNNPVARFHASYTVNQETGCWEWTAWRHPKGYGIICIGGTAKKVRAHRFSWELHNGPIPPGILVLHKCDVRFCCNPEHLFLGDDGVNARDMVAKGRHSTQIGTFALKVTAPMALNIRVMFARGMHSMVSIASIYGLDHSTVSDIVRGRSHLGEGRLKQKPV